MRDPYGIWIDPSKPAPQAPPSHVTPTKQEKDEAWGKVAAFVVGVGMLLLAVFGNGGDMKGWEYILGVPGAFAVWYGLSED